jgi:hypothetical protein
VPSKANVDLTVAVLESAAGRMDGVLEVYFIRKSDMHTPTCPISLLTTLRSKKKLTTHTLCE